MKISGVQVYKKEIEFYFKIKSFDCERMTGNLIFLSYLKGGSESIPLYSYIKTKGINNIKQVGKYPGGFF